VEVSSDSEQIELIMKTPYSLEPSLAVLSGVDIEEQDPKR